jgi:hypothetical protein
VILLTNSELIKALKYISRKKTVTFLKIKEQLIPDGYDILRSSLFNKYVIAVSKIKFVGGRPVYYDDDVFKLNDNGHNLLTEHAKESKAIRRANFALLLSLLAVLVAVAALAYNIFTP